MVRDAQATWLPSSNFTRGRWWNNVDIWPNLIVLHTTEGSYESALSWLRGAAGGTNNQLSSSTYLVDRNGGRLACLVDEADTPWTNGNWEYNVRSVTIEMGDYYAGRGGFTDQLYQNVGALVGRIASRNLIPLDRSHVIGHSEVPYQNHWDPGPHFDWDKLLFAAKGGLVVPVQKETPETIHFPETGYTLGGGFLRYWLHEGGLEKFGFPITNEIETGDPNVPRIQYFQRARFEWHPRDGDPAKWHVMLGLIGVELLQAKGIVQKS